ncbi:small, acid-soluble spore protein, alpha/beta type [uncultured Clostridium sp.]|uniref:small, acid-soluble spore protein, alpha/beta type n=1 Tax=Clostridium sp. TaxID=1506 RepID=UPI0025F24A57|nr:small, acid-soluble spore protein, alpha/beta type [uncultured Clostridium sp.]
MSHKNNKNSKNNKKSNKKTKAELHKMKVETANEVGYSKESRKLGKDQPRSDSAQKIGQ